VTLARFIGHRLLSAAIVTIGVTFLTFVVSRVIVPNPAAAWAGLTSNPAIIQNLAKEYHLDDPLYLQFFYYMYGIAIGNWGVSPRTRLPVLYQIGEYFPATAELVIFSMLISLVLGTIFGVVAATKHDTPVDHLLRVTYLSGIATPPFLAALIALLIFTHYIPIFPSGGQLSQALAPPPRITGMILLDSLLVGNLGLFINALWHIILPALVLAFLGFGMGARILRASMLDALSQDYIRTARAKGLEEGRVVWRHAFRNALISATTVLALSVSALLGGTVVVEYIFSWPGIGFFAVNSILGYDFPSVIGTTLVYAVCVVIANLVADITYALLDPRIKV
jgi:ABC-type dipeptide/oligopeptide/nickel transport system permease component